ncbi:hypothetical protein CGZ92_10580 [Parenemella sanctibonifatiensis]|uniref:DUF1707 domain-containing protein n=2 Tax=Parenemella sanctibonifatiensis TaxID=2016505 RepID=A0A255E173_9ACTN|nr:hypothetical protein CGZ92_10580 [Parenemella sanctibonifatiensis]
MSIDFRASADARAVQPPAQPRTPGAHFLVAPGSRFTPGAPTMDSMSSTPSESPRERRLPERAQHPGYTPVPRPTRSRRSNGTVRVGDRTRQAVGDLLASHYAAGRLTQSEFDERLSTCMSARTRADLDPLLADLPRIPMPAPQQHRPPTPALPAKRSIRKQAVTGILAVGGVGAVVGLWTMMTLSIVLGTGIFAAAAGAMIATAILTLVVSGEERPKS